MVSFLGPDTTIQTRRIHIPQFTFNTLQSCKISSDSATRFYRELPMTGTSVPKYSRYLTATILRHYPTTDDTTEIYFKASYGKQSSVPCRLYISCSGHLTDHRRHDVKVPLDRSLQRHPSDGGSTSHLVRTYIKQATLLCIFKGLPCPTKMSEFSCHTSIRCPV